MNLFLLYTIANSASITRRKKQYKILEHVFTQVGLNIIPAPHYHIEVVFDIIRTVSIGAREQVRVCMWLQAHVVCNHEHCVIQLSKLATRR